MTDGVPQAVKPPVYFLSYAHADPPMGLNLTEARGDDRYVWQFHNDLSGHVGRLVGGFRAGAEPGFIDRTIRSGQKWVPTIWDAVRTVPVFVALLSADYMNSEWCALEWNAFSRRRPIRRDGRPELRSSTLVPVQWSPVDTSLIPRAIADVQHYSPNIRDNDELSREYKEHGIYGLLAEHQEIHYDILLWRLARHIAGLHFTYQVPVDQDLPKARLRKTFGKGAGR